MIFVSFGTHYMHCVRVCLLQSCTMMVVAVVNDCQLSTLAVQCACDPSALPHDLRFTKYTYNIAASEN